jgi:hypothetical protein
MCTLIAWENAGSKLFLCGKALHGVVQAGFTVHNRHLRTKAASVQSGQQYFVTAFTMPQLLTAFNMVQTYNDILDS